MADVLSQDDSPLSFMPGSPMLAPPPPAPPMAPQPVASGGAAAPAPPGAPNLQDIISKATGQGDAAIAEAQKSQAAGIAAMEAKAKAQQPFVDKALSAAQQPIMQPPKLEKPPAVPQGRDQHADENWLFAASILGSLAGAFTRNHATNALAAFSGAMEGYNEGNKQKIAENMKIWEAENKRVQETNQEAMTEYKAALENRKFSVDQMSTAIELAGMKYKDEAAIQAARTKNSLVMAQYFDKRAEAAEKMQAASDSLVERREARQARDKQAQLEQADAWASSQLASPEVQARIRAIQKLDLPPPSSTAARNTPMGMLDAKITNELAARGYDRTAWDKKLAGQRVEGTTDARVKQRTEIAFAVGVPAQRIQSLNVAVSHLGTVSELAKDLGNSDFPALNRISNFVEEQLGYAMPTNFDAAKQIVTAEVLKAVVQNGGGVREREEYAGQLAKANSYGQLEGVVNTYLSLLGGQLKGLKKTYESKTKKTDFNDMLEPETIKALEGAGVAPIPKATPPGYSRTGSNTGVADQALDLVTRPLWPSSQEGMNPPAAGSAAAAWERAHPHLPDWLRLPEGWTAKPVQ